MENKMPGYSFYEFVAYLVPGFTFTFLLISLLATSLIPIELQKISLGGFAFILTFSYISGIILQTLSIIIEYIWQILGKGKPDEYFNPSNEKIVGKQLSDEFFGIIKFKYEIEETSLYDLVNTKKWPIIFRQMRSTVTQYESSKRLNIMRGNYSMFRCLSFIFISFDIFYFSVSTFSLTMKSLFLFLSIVCLLRMKHFGVSYIRELIIEYVRIKKSDTENPVLNLLI